jgi:hypothetical protein
MDAWRPKHAEDEHTIKWLWMWKCIKLVTLLWYKIIHGQQNIKFALLISFLCLPGGHGKCLQVLLFHDTEFSTLTAQIYLSSRVVFSTVSHTNPPATPHHNTAAFTSFRMFDYVNSLLWQTRSCSRLQSVPESCECARSKIIEQSAQKHQYRNIHHFSHNSSMKLILCRCYLSRSIISKRIFVYRFDKARI